jgi:hypothetical protein
MTPFKEAELAPAIQSCVDMVEQARAGLAATVSRVQGSCEHRIVGEAQYESPNMNTERICLHCRLRERGSHWSGMGHFSREDYGPASLGNEPGRIVNAITRDELHKMSIAL